MCVFISRTSFYETFLVIRRNERNAIKNVHWSSCKIHVIFIRFHCNIIFLTYFLNITKQISRKIRKVEADVLHAGEANGRTVLTKLTVALRNFANVPTNGTSYRARSEPTNIKTKKCEFTPRPFLTPKS